jgi:hypothetical protein
MPNKISNRRKKVAPKTGGAARLPRRAVALPALPGPAAPKREGETGPQAQDASPTPGDGEEGTRRKARERSAAYEARRREENARRAEERAAAREATNPLLDLSEERRSKLFAWLRACPYDDAVQQMLRDEGLPGITAPQLSEFFQLEAESHWEKRIERAALEANALVQLVERNPVRFSSGILAALGQEAFRQIASGEVAPEAMNKMASLFLKARADERADQMHVLKREKARQEVIGRVNVALEKFSEEVNRNPVSREIFEALRRELRNSVEGEMTELRGATELTEGGK